MSLLLLDLLRMSHLILSIPEIPIAHEQFNGLHMIMNKPVELLFTQFIWEKISEHLCVDIVLPDVI